MKANDIPVSDLELAGMYGTPQEPFPLQVEIAIRAIRQIQEHNFSPEAAAALVSALECRIAGSTFKHMKNRWVDVPGALEYLQDAHSMLED
jgi:hypothetical protein